MRGFFDSAIRLNMTNIKKRDGSVVSFDSSKIMAAITKCLDECYDEYSGEYKTIPDSIKSKCDSVVSVEDIQDKVENSLMNLGYNEAAKAYILYRNERARNRKPDIFAKRVNLKPYEYPQLLEYVDAIRHSYWVHSEFNFTSDIQDYKTQITESEREAIKRTMLAISQIEVAVKTFWGGIHEKMQKPEIGSVGATFSESEVRHQDAYSHLLEILGLNSEFDNIGSVPVLINRVKYLDSAMTNAKSDSNKDYAETVLLFSLFIEHVSLFSQFLIMMAFNKHKNIFKGISNVVEATSKEEMVHGNFGIDIIRIIKDENPEWFDDAHSERVTTLCKQAYDAESGIIDWIFEKGELSFLSKYQIKEFIKNRFNKSLESINIDHAFEVDQSAIECTDWFDDEIIGTKHGDFFVKRSINYNKRSKSVTEDDLF